MAAPRKRTLVAASAALMAAVVAFAPQPASAFFCFDFSFGGGPSFRVGFNGPRYYGTYWPGPRGYPPPRFMAPPAQPYAAHFPPYPPPPGPPPQFGHARWAPPPMPPHHMGPQYMGPHYMRPGAASPFPYYYGAPPPWARR